MDEIWEKLINVNPRLCINIEFSTQIKKSDQKILIAQIDVQISLLSLEKNPVSIHQLRVETSAHDYVNRRGDSVLKSKDDVRIDVSFRKVSLKTLKSLFG